MENKPDDIWYPGNGINAPVTNTQIPVSSSNAREEPPRLNHSTIISSNIFTTDISTDFRNAVSRLPAGVLIKDELFTLFEAVGALEIGDPKMDSGCLDENEPLEDAYDVTQDLKPEEAIWIMDQIVAREVAWLMGYPLSQTLFTSVYIDRLLSSEPTTLSAAQFDKIQSKQVADILTLESLRVFCLALVKSCDFILLMVTSQHFYEEEDFTTQLFNKDLLSKFNATDIISLVESVANDISTSPLPERSKQALLSRLAFQAEMLRMFKQHAVQTCLTDKHLLRINSILDDLRDTSNYGIPVHDAFSTKIQRRLASTVPPRPMIAVDLDKSWSFWEELLNDSTNVFEVFRATNTEDLMTAYTMLCAQQRQPSTYVRALLQSFLGHNSLITGRWSIEDFIHEDLQTLTLAASPMLESVANGTNIPEQQRLQVQELANDFLKKFSHTFTNTYRTLCLNRCRTRRTLCHSAIEWDQIQAEIEELDESIQNLMQERQLRYPPNSEPTSSYGLSSWIYHHKLLHLRLIIQTGFELSIYAPHELSGMYWYLAHITDIHMSHLERISYFVSKRESSLSQSSPSYTKHVRQCKKALRRLYRHFTWLKATHALASTLHDLFMIMQRYGEFEPAAATYSSDRLRFDIRMRPFLGMSIPDPPLFDEMHRQQLSQSMSSDSIIMRASTSSSAAKKAWEEVLKNGWRDSTSQDNEFHMQSGGATKTNSLPVVESTWNDNVRGAIRASIAASVTLITLKRKLEDSTARSQPTLKAELPKEKEKDFWHPWWRIPRML